MFLVLGIIFYWNMDIFMLLWNFILFKPLGFYCCFLLVYWSICFLRWCLCCPGWSWPPRHNLSSCFSFPPNWDERHMPSLCNYFETLIWWGGELADSLPPGAGKSSSYLLSLHWCPREVPFPQSLDSRKGAGFLSLLRDASYCAVQGMKSLLPSVSMPGLWHHPGGEP